MSDLAAPEILSPIIEELQLERWLSIQCNAQIMYFPVELKLGIEERLLVI